MIEEACVAIDTVSERDRRLREAKARAFTKEEVPFVTGIRKELVVAIRDLV